jgi:dihydroxy-acid dehydratase
VRIDLKQRSANILVSEVELERRRVELARRGGYAYPKSQTPWQQIQRELVTQFDEGMVLRPAVNYQRLAQTAGTPRDNH